MSSPALLSVVIAALLFLIPLTPAMADDPQYSPTADTCLGQLPGDANGDGVIDVSDPVFLIKYVCKDEAPPNPLSNGDANGDCVIDTFDVNYIIASIFLGGPAPVDCTCLQPEKGECAHDICELQFPGDANGDGFIDVADSKYLINYLCLDGEAPSPLANGDPNGDCIIDSLDIDHIIKYIFQNGDAPVDCTCPNPIKGDCWVDTCEIQYPGDANGNGMIDVGDAAFIGFYLCLGGDAPYPLANGDPNGDCVIDSLDLEYLVAFLFFGGDAPVDCTCLSPEPGPCPQYNCGDFWAGEANGDHGYNIGDAVFVINYIFKGGHPPYPYQVYSGDANCDCVVNIGDVVWTINRIFKGGQPPCTCEEWLSHCAPPLR